MLGLQHGQDCSSNVHALGVGAEHNLASGLKSYKNLQRFHAIYILFSVSYDFFPKRRYNVDSHDGCMRVGLY
jgi:hypothetical protein